MTLAFILVVLCLAAVNLRGGSQCHPLSSIKHFRPGFLAVPLTIEWLRFVLATVYLLVRESRARGTQPDFQTVVMMFCAELL